MKTRLRSRRRRHVDQPSESLEETAENNSQMNILSSLETNEESHKAANENTSNSYPKVNNSEQRRLRKKLNYNIQTVVQNLSMTESENTDLEKEKFVPAAQFFSGSETPDKLTSDYFSGSDTPSKLRESTRRLSVRKPYSSYIAYSSDEELEEWWQEPKTDYTYSVSLSYRDRVTPERKIGSPNMSRRGLRYSGTYTDTSSGTKMLDLRSRSIPKRNLDAFSDGSDGEEPEIIRSRSRLDKNIRSSNRNISESYTSNLRTTSESVDYGLDDSDSDNNSLSHLAKPLIRRGRTSLMRSSTPLLPDPYSTPSSNSINGVANLRMANHITKTTVYTATSTNGNRVHGQFENNETSSWKERLSTWSHLSWTTFKTITSVLVTSVLLCTIRLTDNVKRLKNYYIRPYQSYSNLDLSDNNFNVEENNLTIRPRSPEPVSYIKTVIMHRTQTVLATSQAFYNQYQEKRRNSPILWGWLPILLVLLLFLPFCAFWLRQPSESLGTPASSYSSRSWQSLIPTIIIQSLTDFTKWLTVVFLNFTSLLWNLITCLRSNLYYLFVVALNSLNYVWVGFCNVLSSIFGSRLNTIVIPSTEKEIDYQPTSYENSWVHSSVIFVYQSMISIERGCQVILTYGGASVSYTSTCLTELLLSLWNVAAWLCLGLWSMIIFVFTSMGSIIASVFSSLIIGTYSIMGLVAGCFKFSVPHGSQSFEKPDFPQLKVPVPVPQTVIQNHASDVDLLAQLLQSPHVVQLLSSSFDENFSKKGISKEEINVFRSSILSEFDLLRSDLTHNGKTNFNHILVLKNQQENLLKQIKDMEIILNAVKSSCIEGSELTKNTKTSLENMISKISSDILNLTGQLDELQKSHESLKFDVKSCCHSTSLSLKDVENHVNLLLSDIFGFNIKKKNLDAIVLQHSLNTSQLGAWFGSYFVAKEELENKLKHLMENIKTNIENNNYNYETTLEETVKQTTQIVMNDVIKNIRDEIHLQQQVMNQQLKEVVDSSKSEQETFLNLIAEEKKTLEESLNGAHQESTKHTKIALDEAFSNGLPDNIAFLITNSIDLALKKHHNEQVNVVKEQLNDALEEKLNSGVKQIIESRVVEIFKEYGISLDNSNTIHISSSKNTEVPLEQSHEFGASRFNSNSLIGDINPFGFNESMIKQIVNKAISKYDADKTGMVDHALESAGGNIVSTRCTEAYQGHQAELTIFGYPIYRYTTNTPRSIIQPDRMPGQCYAFKGSQGFIVIHFAGPVKVTAFSLEHIPKVLSPTTTIDSAPKDFSVFGLQTPNEEGYHLGNFAYKDDGEPLQYFPVANYTDEYFKYVELKVNSNHGNIHYTCIYRFRVHGVRQF